MGTRYLKQLIVLRKDLSMPTGKAAAMAAHAAMTFLLAELREQTSDSAYVHAAASFTPEQWRWLTELDPGIEATGQVSMAKIVCEVKGEPELLAVEKLANDAGLACHRVIDSGFAHNKPGTFVGIAIGPDWPEKLEPVTGGLKIYR